MRILAISGSLRRDSHNTRLLRAAAQMLPPGAELELFDGLSDVPPYNEDADIEPAPEGVERLRAAIADADALVISTPEYNASIPGVLKNAVDWASRPALASPLAGKPVAIVGASTGLGGTARAQQQLRDALEFPRALVLDEPRVLVPEAFLRFDRRGDLVDEAVREELADLLDTLVQAAGGVTLAA
jgi:chromate reductase, NAD(P)H dehydrogenase (quinone)